ncbi:MAG: hypothetical protein IPJ55_15840 [Chloracidobacterium sp.]|nr:hypothetical protein [Chloracidobacterium sp.]
MKVGGAIGRLHQLLAERQDRDSTSPRILVTLRLAAELFEAVRTSVEKVREPKAQDGPDIYVMAAQTCSDASKTISWTRWS